MQTFRVMKPTSYASVNNLTVEQFVNQIQSKRVVDPPQEVPELLEYQYAWYSTGNKAHAFEFMQAYILAVKMGLHMQVELNLKQVVYYLTKDMAERFYGLAMQRLDYTGSIRVEHYQREEPSPGFRILIGETVTTRMEWVFEPINRFRQQIPLHALKAITMFQQDNLEPYGYWVADKIETVNVRSYSVDPILCAQFGQWFAGIAMWL